MAELTTQAIAQDFARDGAFHTINDYVREKKITAETASAWTAQLFAVFEEKIKEAQREVQHLQTNLMRLAAVAARRKRKHAYKEIDPHVVSLAQELTTFDGWVMSIYETDLTMISYGAPERARAKPGEMAKSMEALYAKRLDEMKFTLNAPDLFKLG
jgi:hypothetical protein